MIWDYSRHSGFFLAPICVQPPFKDTTTGDQAALLTMPSPAPAAPEEVPAWLAHILPMQSQQIQHLTELMTTLSSTRSLCPRRQLHPCQSPIHVETSYEKCPPSTTTRTMMPLIDDRGSTLSEERKRNLIVDKLDRAAYKTYSEHVLPLKRRDIDLPTTLLNLTKLLGHKDLSPLTCRRFEFLQSTCKAFSGSFLPYREFGSTIKKKFEEAYMRDVDGESLKCLVLISGLTDSSHPEMRLRLLNKINRLSEGDRLWTTSSMTAKPLSYCGPTTVLWRQKKSTRLTKRRLGGRRKVIPLANGAPVTFERTTTSYFASISEIGTAAKETEEEAI
ncbi:hypothetical protein ANCDUO_13022 [Ancylostoma duodenale]|uniref:DUF7083 domain-containing protein n=1 Tax=Ancylostoma duodenale TaxID=51022 RepID=A0A0C2GI69_9BILA|nr:hypothetical protein ANCDUO_13022 [Ancylostoma duodenale]